MKLRALREGVALELEHVQQTVRHAEGLLEQVAGREATVYDRAAGAMLVAQFYNGIENMLKRISAYHEVGVPTGERSHAKLFKRFCDPPAAPLPMLFPNAVEEDFVILRRFRHFIRHSYAI